MLKMLRQPPAFGRHWRLLVAAVLVVGLAMTAAVWYEYQTTKKPLQDLATLPVVPDVLTSDAPRYIQSIYGETALARPLGVAVSSEGGHIYVTESAGTRGVRVFDATGTEVGSLDAPTDVPGYLPMYTALAPDGRLFVSDRPNDAIYTYSADGAYLGQFQPQGIPAGEWHPMGVTFDEAGDLYVTDVTSGKHRVLVFDSSGALKLQFGSEGSEEGQFWFPNGIAVDGRGRIFVADGNNGRVQVFDAQGNYLAEIPRGYGPADLAMPRGLAVSGDRLFVVDTASHAVKVYNVSGDRPVFRADFGAFGVEDGQFRFPNGVAVAGEKVYVTDREGGRLEIWSY